MAQWKKAAARAKSLLGEGTSNEGRRTLLLINHIEDESHDDGYISKDFFNVQQTAGGLTESVSMEQYLGLITGHIREDLGGDAFDDAMTDEDFRTALFAIDASIRRHIVFLNGVTHQAAAGEVHLALWQRILDARSDEQSVYSCYRDYLIGP
jgi:hypothetical protein